MEQAAESKWTESSHEEKQMNSLQHGTVELRQKLELGAELLLQLTKQSFQAEVLGDAWGSEGRTDRTRKTWPVKQFHPKFKAE